MGTVDMKKKWLTSSCPILSMNKGQSGGNYTIIMQSLRFLIIYIICIYIYMYHRYHDIIIRIIMNDTSPIIGSYHPTFMLFFSLFCSDRLIVATRQS